MELVEFLEEIRTLEAFFEKELSIEQANDWYEELKKYPIEKLRIAIKEAKRSCKFLPKLAEFLTFIREAKVEIEKKERIECSQCNKTGYVQYIKKIVNGNKILEYTYMAVCKCGNEHRYDGTQIKDREHRSKNYTAMEEEIISQGYTPRFNERGGKKIFTGYDIDLWR